MSRMNNDLISRTAVLQILYDVKDDDDTPKNYGTLLDIIRQIRELPVAFDKEQVIEQIEKYMQETSERIDEKIRAELDICYSEGLYDAFTVSRTCVEKGGIE